MSPFPSGRGFNQQKSHITAMAEVATTQRKEPRAPVTEKDLQESSLFTSCRALPRMSGSPRFPVVGIVFPIFGGFGCWGTPSMFALDSVIALLSAASLRFPSWLPTKSRGVSWGVRESLAKSSFTLVVCGWQEDLWGISNWPKPSKGNFPSNTQKGSVQIQTQPQKRKRTPPKNSPQTHLCWLQMINVPTKDLSAVLCSRYMSLFTL